VIRLVVGQDTIQRDCHDGSIVQDGNDQNHEWREVKLKGEGHDSKANNNTDSDGAGVDGIISHALEDNSRLADSVYDGGQPWLGENNVGSSSGSIGCTLDCDSDVGTGKLSDQKKAINVMAETLKTFISRGNLPLAHHWHRHQLHRNNAKGW